MGGCARLDQGYSPAGKRPEYVFSGAIGATNVSIDRAGGILSAAMQRRRFADPPAAYDRNGTYLRAWLLGREDGGFWIAIEDQASSCDWLAAEIATAVASSVDYHEVRGTDDPVTDKNGDLGYRISITSSTIEPDGRRKPIETPEFEGDDDPILNFGDFHETLDHTLTLICDAAAPKNGGARRVDFYRPPAGAPADPRIEDLIRQSRGARDVSVQMMDGVPFLRIVAADGSRRMAKVTEGDLSVIRDATGLDLRTTR